LCPILAQNYAYTYTPGCLNAMEAISKLQLSKARGILQEERKKSPNNLATEYLADCADYYELITCGDKNLLAAADKNRSARLSRLQKLNTAQTAYAVAELQMHHAIVKLMQQEYVSGAMELRNAYQAHQKNSTDYPSFVPTRKSLGFIKGILGTLPESYNWMLNIVGLKGNFKEGMALLESYFAQQHNEPEYRLSNQQADFYYVLLQFYYGNKTTAYTHAQQHTTDYSENMLSCYLRAFVASHCAHTDEAISILNKQPHGDEYPKYYDLDFTMGYAKLNKLDTDADIEFKKVVTFSKNNSLRKDAYKRLSWSALIQKDQERYLTYRRLAFSMSSYKDDEDALTDKDLEKGIYPNTNVLKARLLFDGGYYVQAEELIKTTNISSLKGFGQVAEFYYRYGRIMQEQKKYAKAIEFYTESINVSEKKNLHFAPYSALQLGNIYAKLGYAQTALFYYNKALGYKNYKDQGYVAQKARQASAELSAH
jgi:hypothetical protein